MVRSRVGGFLLHCGGKKQGKNYPRRNSIFHLMCLFYLITCILNNLSGILEGYVFNSI